MFTNLPQNAGSATQLLSEPGASFVADIHEVIASFRYTDGLTTTWGRGASDYQYDLIDDQWCDGWCSKQRCLLFEQADHV